MVPKKGFASYRCKSSDNYLWRRVRGLSFEKFDGPVFNMSVEGDNSYVAEGVGVHNCAGHAEALACSHANFVATGEVLRFSRRFAYITAQKRGGFSGDSGTSITSTLEAATNDGVCRETACPFQEEYSQNLSPAAYAEAKQHRHHGDTAYDCRDWNTALAWLTDAQPRCIIIGTKWFSGQDECNGVEDADCSTGRFRGYHARLLCGWDTYQNELCPVVQNSHGTRWGSGGRAIITPDQWAFWSKDANFFALGFNRIDEIEPQRKSWSESKPGDVC